MADEARDGVGEAGGAVEGLHAALGEAKQHHVCVGDTVGGVEVLEIEPDEVAAGGGAVGVVERPARVREPLAALLEGGGLRGVRREKREVLGEVGGEGAGQGGVQGDKVVAIRPETV